MELAFSVNLFSRIRSLTPPDLLFAICAESIKGAASYNDLASQIEAEGGASVSRQAIWKKVKTPCIVFLMRILEHVILNKINNHEVEMLRSSAKYKRILVQDSTIVKLPSRLFDIFSGVSNGHSRVCNARIQGTYDILAERFVAFSIDTYSKNDLKAAPEISLQAGDLVLRDRGYLIIDEIQRHIDNGADCIFRHKYSMIMLAPKTGLPIDILTLLRGKGKLDMDVMLNNNSKTIVRLVAVPVKDEVANIRRMKAKKENKTPPSKSYLELLSWSVFITTIPQNHASPAEIFELYSLRWRIEIIFKSWKSNMSFDKIHNVSYVQLHVLLLARFIMILVLTQNIYRQCRTIIKMHHGKYLSLLKLTNYLFRNPRKIAVILYEINKYEGETCKNINTLAKYCSYDKRRNRQNYEQQMDKLFSLS